MGLSADKLKNSPWNHEVDLPSNVLDVPSLLTLEERRMLAWISRNHMEGTICELGPFLGGSTVALAYGVESSSNPYRIIHSYDQFRCPVPTLKRFISEDMIALCKPNGDFKAVYDSHISAYEALIRPHQGDVILEEWPKQNQIGVLFIDIMKTWDVCDAVMKTFFPALRPGSIIVHQDYIYDRCPWVIYTIDGLGSKVEFVGSTEKYSAIFEVKAEISDADVNLVSSQTFTPERFIDAISRSRKMFSSLEHIFMLDSALQNVADHPTARYEGDYPPMKKYIS